ncbi:MAG: phosphotransferase, partial [Pseudomonadota bacterium]
MLESELAEKFAAYAEARLPGARNARVDSINRIHGGASRQTYSIDLAYEDATGPKTKGLILRRDPPDSLIDTERRVEFAAIQSAYGQFDLPVPEALFLETGTDALGAPFFVMGRIETGDPVNPFKIEDIEPHRAAIGEQFFRHLGSIAALPVEGS